jgi:hypothetical protein
MKVALPTAVYYGIIDAWTTPTERLIHSDSGTPLPGGLVEFELQEQLATELRLFMLDGESYADALERLLAKNGGKVS